MQPIIITLDGGVIQDIKNIPFGIEIRVKDFDIQNADEEDLVKDGLGNAYTESIWKSTQEEPDPYQELLFLEHKGIKVYHTYWNKMLLVSTGTHYIQKFLKMANLTSGI